MNNAVLLWLDVLILWAAFVIGLISFRRAERRYVESGREFADMVQKLATEADNDRRRADAVSDVLAQRLGALETSELARFAVDTKAFDDSEPTKPHKPSRKRAAKGTKGARGAGGAP